MKHIIFLLLVSITTMLPLQCNLQKQIEEIKESLSIYYDTKTKSLDLSELALTNKIIDSPKWNAALTHFAQKHIIKTVNLKQNKLTKIPRIIYLFPKVEKIDLRKNNIPCKNFEMTAKNITNIAKLFDKNVLQAGTYQIYKLISSKDQKTSIMVISPHYQERGKTIMLEKDTSITIICNKPASQKKEPGSWIKTMFFTLLPFATGILVCHACSTLL